MNTHTKQVSVGYARSFRPDRFESATERRAGRLRDDSFKSPEQAARGLIDDRR